MRDPGGSLGSSQCLVPVLLRFDRQTSSQPIGLMPRSHMKSCLPAMNPMSLLKLNYRIE
jgi:hypothetical protein